MNVKEKSGFENELPRGKRRGIGQYYAASSEVSDLFIRNETISCDDGFDGFLKIMDRLLAEDGCPWDREQTHRSLRQYLLEECYEAVDAIDSNDMSGLCEELGDVLLEVIFQCKIAEGEGVFTTADMIRGISEKMVRRHPHIFKENAEQILDAEKVLDNWDKIKKNEKEYISTTDELRAVPKALPALTRAEKVLKRAEKKSAGNSAEIEDIIAELRESLEAVANIEKTHNNEEISELYGRFLLSAVKLSRKIQINAEFSLTNAIETFINKFEHRENGIVSILPFKEENQ